MAEDGACECVKVSLRGHEALFRMPGGEELSASQELLSRSKVLRLAIYMSEQEGETSLTLGKGFLGAWLQCVQALGSNSCEPSRLPAHAEVCSEHGCDELTASQIVTCFKVRWMNRWHKRVTASAICIERSHCVTLTDCYNVHMPCIAHARVLKRF